MHKSTSSIVGLISNAAQGAFFFGYAVSYMNPSIFTVNYWYGINDFNDKDATGDSDLKRFVDATINGNPLLIIALPAIGAALGGFLSSHVLHRYSIRQAMILTDMIGIIGCGLQLVVNLGTLLLARLIIGIAVGLNSAIVPQYIKEFAPRTLSGSLGAMNQMSINVGALVALCLGIGYVEQNSVAEDKHNLAYMRLVFDLPMLLCAMRTCLLLLVYDDEPPRYYISKGKNPKAKMVIRSIYERDSVDQVYNDMVQEVNARKSVELTYGELFSNSTINRRVYVGSGLSILQQFSGINAVLIYSSGIFEDLYDNKTKNALNVTIGVINLLFSIIAIPIMKKFGRRPLLLWGTLVCSICLFLLAIFAYVDAHFNDDDESTTYKLMIIVFMFLYLAAFQLSLGPVVWVYLADILPEKGLSIAVLANWISCAAVAIIFNFLRKSGLDTSFGLFGVITLLGVGFVFKYVLETKDQSADQIENNYSIIGVNRVIDSGIDNKTSE